MDGPIKRNFIVVLIRDIRLREQQTMGFERVPEASRFQLEVDNETWNWSAVSKLLSLFIFFSFFL